MNFMRLQAENTPELIQAFQTFFTQVGQLWLVGGTPRKTNIDTKNGHI